MSLSSDRHHEDLNSWGRLLGGTCFTSEFMKTEEFVEMLRGALQGHPAWLSRRLSMTRRSARKHLHGATKDEVIRLARTYEIDMEHQQEQRSVAVWLAKKKGLTKAEARTWLKGLENHKYAEVMTEYQRREIVRDVRAEIVESIGKDEAESDFGKELVTAYAEFVGALGAGELKQLYQKLELSRYRSMTNPEYVVGKDGKDQRYPQEITQFLAITIGDILSALKLTDGGKRHGQVALETLLCRLGLGHSLGSLHEAIAEKTGLSGKKTESLTETMFRVVLDKLKEGLES